MGMTLTESVDSECTAKMDRNFNYIIRYTPFFYFCDSERPAGPLGLTFSVPYKHRHRRALVSLSTCVGFLVPTDRRFFSVGVPKQLSFQLIIYQDLIHKRDDGCDCLQLSHCRGCCLLLLSLLL